MSIGSKFVLGMILALVVLGSAVIALSPLKAFNALAPADSGTDRVLEGVAYGADPRQKLDLYRPAGVPGPLPVVIFCYGGGWSWGERGAYEFIGRSLAAEGYLAVVFDYRLVPRVRYPAFVEDTAAAVAWSVAHAGEHGGDASRLFLIGHSAGAYNVAQVALDGSFLAVHGLGPGIVKGVASLAGPLDFLPLDDPSAIAAFGQWPDPEDTQPVAHVTRFAPPFLLLIGSADSTVLPRNSESLARRLEEAGVPHRLITYGGLGHAMIMLAMSRPLRWRAPVLADIMAFFAEVQSALKSSARTP